MGNENIKTFTQKPHISESNNICFGGEKEQEMINKFISFDILWYAPDSSEKLENWKAFTNVNVYKVSEENEFINIIEMGQKLYTIIIATGSFAEKTAPKLKADINRVIIIYCMNSERHKKWSAKYKFIDGVFTQPSEIFNYLLDFQSHDYNIPLFSYSIINAREFNFNYYDYIFEFELLVGECNFSLYLNQYEKFCVDMLHSFRLADKNIDDNFFLFSMDSSNVIGLFYGQNYNINKFQGMTNFLANNKKVNEVSKELLTFLMRLTLISIYFSKLPYLFGTLSYEETETILKEELTLEGLQIDYFELLNYRLNVLYHKLNKEKVSILDKTEHLKFLHIFLINFLKRIIKLLYGFNFDDYSKFPYLVNNFMDLDFCLKLFFFRVYGGFKCDIYKIKCRASLLESDQRIMTSNGYFSTHMHEKDALKSISIKDLKAFNENLKIRNFIVLGKKNFHKKIKNIEKNFSDEKTTISYLEIKELKDYLDLKRKTDNYRKFDYFVIMKAKYAENIYKDLFKIYDEFALRLYLLIYINHDKTLINKKPIIYRCFMPIYFFYHINSITNFIISQNNLCCAYNLNEEMSRIIKKLNQVKYPKVWNQNNDLKVDKKNSENGWQLVESVPEEIFKITILGSIGDFVAPIDKFKVNIFNVYKENNLLSLFYEKYSKYFSFSLMPEFENKKVGNFIKQFCYAYSLEEPIKEQSFYYFLNKDLRSGVPSRIEKYIEIINLINVGIEKKCIKSYKGQLFRGSYVEKDFAENKIIEGKLLTNLSFWSASKNRKTSESFAKNILFIIETKGKNIDIHEEKISKFDNEEEVLFLPFSKFLIVSKIKKKLGTKEIYEVKLEGKEELHERGKISSVSISWDEFSFLNEII